LITEFEEKLENLAASLDAFEAMNPLPNPKRKYFRL
jgi:hypothetical protein